MPVPVLAPGGGLAMPSKVLFDRKFDARPDRIDFRDLDYRAPLVTLPDQYPDPWLIETYFPLYSRHDMVLDQGTEGACTGFGLAAVVNYLRWARTFAPQIAAGKKTLARKDRPSLVSPRMLYQNARLYDEWRGEDYEGSSCRGAMKGLHKHGVCTDPAWPYLEKDGSPGHSRKEWADEAARCPLGAYYRIDARSLVDMQAAINEVHAIYVSADVHSGWDMNARSSLERATIRPKKAREKTGGHAFAVVGYTPDGFIVQNSWGPKWGFHGFSLLPYEEWSERGQDAWVLALGAPMRTVRSPNARTAISLQDRAAIKATIAATAAANDDAAKVGHWTDGEESVHTVFIGHDGRPERELVEATDAADAVRRVIEDGVIEAARKGRSKVAIYAHGGLNNQDAGLKRARILGPWLEANGIHPVFIIWQTGFLESAGDIIKIQVDKMGPGAAAAPVEGWFIDQLKETKDRGFESTARNFGVKAIWENMKSRAGDASAKERGGMTLVAKHLQAARDALKDKAPEIHLLGHSAGAIMLGYFLGALKNRALKAASVHLWAPACTAGFAVETFGAAFANGTASPKATYVGVLTDKNEASDPCVPVAYSKSLLYLVSRALEPDHKTPVIGMQKSWKPWQPAKNDDFFNTEERILDQLKRWHAAAKDVVVDEPIAVPAVPTRQDDGDVQTIKANHGSFDNNLDVVNQAIARMQGLKKPKVPVIDLRGF
jgi:hypothetical protein